MSGLTLPESWIRSLLNLAAKLQIPHHVGAGGGEDFADKETFQKHIKRINNRNKGFK